MKVQATFSSELGELPRIFLWMEGYLTGLHCDPLRIRKIELAVEEAVVNVIRYSQSAQVEIRIQGEAEKRLEISILDKGPPFNPLKDAPPVDQTSSLEKRKEGGLGIFLMKQAVDEVHYKREGNTNILTLLIFLVRD